MRRVHLSVRLRLRPGRRCGSHFRRHCHLLDILRQRQMKNVLQEFDIVEGRAPHYSRARAFAFIKCPHGLLRTTDFRANGQAPFAVHRRKWQFDGTSLINGRFLKQILQVTHTGRIFHRVQANLALRFVHQRGPTFNIQNNCARLKTPINLYNLFSKHFQLYQTRSTSFTPPILILPVRSKADMILSV